ncbi:MAG: hypothetical protein IKS74_07510 [Methanomicrobium sp.]|nr:hypothetical protein [Methanomicrobium sp.]
MVTYKQLLQVLNSYNPRSAWDKGVKKYAIGIIKDFDYESDNGGIIPNNFGEKYLLNGARDWKQYSWGGSSYAYDGDIAKMLCSPSELKKVRYKEGGFRKPNRDEEWLDVQARALSQASRLILYSYRALVENRSLKAYGY